MVDIKYANAYSEILEILKYIPTEDYKKIPKNKIKLFETNSNKNYKFVYDPNLTLDEQNATKITKVIIAILFRDYWATPEQREKIIAKENYDRAQMEKEKIEQFKPDDLFKNKKTKETKSENISMKNLHIQEQDKTSLPIKIKKQGFFVKIINFIKNIFKH